MIYLKDQIEYTDPNGEKLVGQVVSKSDEGVLECNLLYPTKTKQPGNKFFVNMDDKNIKKANIKSQPYDKHKSQYVFNKESMEIVKDEEAILKLGMRKLASLNRKYSGHNDLGGPLYATTLSDAKQELRDEYRMYNIKYIGERKLYDENMYNRTLPDGTALLAFDPEKKIYHFYGWERDGGRR